MNVVGRGGYFIKQKENAIQLQGVAYIYFSFAVYKFKSYVYIEL